jgi:hypothetical protein
VPADWPLRVQQLLTAIVSECHEEGPPRRAKICPSLESTRRGPAMLYVGLDLSRKRLDFHAASALDCAWPPILRRRWSTSGLRLAARPLGDRFTDRDAPPSRGVAHDVRVRARGEAGVGVAEVLGDLVERGAFVEEQRGAGVAEVLGRRRRSPDVWTILRREDYKKGPPASRMVDARVWKPRRRSVRQRRRIAASFEPGITKPTSNSQSFHEDHSEPVLLVAAASRRFRRRERKRAPLSSPLCCEGPLLRTFGI